MHTAINMNNLVQICITSNRKPVISNKSTLSAPKLCLFGLLNCRLVRNKYLSIKDYVLDKDFDIFAITETWLNTRDYDNFAIGSLIPNGYRFLHSARDIVVMEEVVASDCSSKVRCQLSKHQRSIWTPSFPLQPSKVKLRFFRNLFPSLLSIVLHRQLETIFLMSFL